MALRNIYTGNRSLGRRAMYDREAGQLGMPGSLRVERRPFTEAGQPGTLSNAACFREAKHPGMPGQLRVERKPKTTCFPYPL